MADNPTVYAGTTGTAVVVSADDAGAEGLVQRVKLTVSADGAVTHIPADAANGLDVDVTRVSGNVTVVDGGGALSVDDGGGSLTVDGTVTANAGSGPWAVTDNGGSLTVDGTVAVSGTVATAEVAASSSSVTAANSSTSSQQLLAATTRKKLVVTNDDANDLLVKLGTTASATSYSYRLAYAATLELENYNGRVDGIWTADGTGGARITELT